MSEQIASLTNEYNTKTDRLEGGLQSARDQIDSMQKEQLETAEKHIRELEDAKRKIAENEQQRFANMSWLERLQKK